MSDRETMMVDSPPSLQHDDSDDDLALEVDDVPYVRASSASDDIPPGGGLQQQQYHPNKKVNDEKRASVSDLGKEPDEENDYESAVEGGGEEEEEEEEEADGEEEETSSESGPSSTSDDSSSSSSASSSPSSSLRRSSRTISRTKKSQEVASVTSRGTNSGALGRGQRAIKSRVVYINGYPVMRENNYQVVGECYVRGSEAVEYLSRERKPSLKELKKNKPQTGTPVRKESQALIRLRQNNEGIKLDKSACEVKRQNFLVHHLPVLEPFLDVRVANQLRALKATPGFNRAIEEPKPLPAQPDYIVGGEMRDYQLIGLSFLINRFQHGIGAILGDEMGLGKTIQTISFVAWLKFERKLPGPYLIVCPLSVISGWMAEFKRWCPSLRAVRLHTADIDERRKQCQELLPRVDDYDVCVTTYDMLKNKICRHMLIHSIHWRYVVFDEGHCLKSPETEITQVARSLHAQNMLLLTGTPLQNNLRELWCLLSLLLPDIFISSDMFDDCFAIHRSESTVNMEMLGKAHDLLKPFMLRRLKSEVEKSLTPRIETQVDCPLSDMQLFYYKRLLQKEWDALRSYDGEEGGGGMAAAEDKEKKARDFKKLQALWVQLRKCCNHPFLFDGAEDDIETTSLKDIVEASGKLQIMDRLLDKLKAAGHRVVIFSQWTHLLDILDDYMSMKGYAYTRLDGGTNRVTRYVNIQSFNAPDSQLFCFLMTTRAGGLGVNLQTADTVILFDSDWNPQPDLQAMARVHRIGQTKVVHVYRLVTTGTIEERIVTHAEKKLFLDQMVNRDSLASLDLDGVHLGGSDTDAVPFTEKRELLSALTFGADRIFRAETGRVLSDADLDAMINRSTTKQPQAEGAGGRAGLLKAEKKDAATFDPTQQGRAVRDLQGVMYERAPESYKDISEEWILRKKRTQKSRVQMVDGRGSGYGGMVPVLQSNNYDLDTGEASVFTRELQGRSDPSQFRDVKRKRAIAGRDYDNDEYCLSCWDGGELILCDHCPASYHRACLGISKQDWKTLSRRQWSCPQHRCAECDRACSAVGGTLFRCTSCPVAYCLDHLPEDHTITGFIHERYEALGFGRVPQACYMHCSASCRDYAKTLESEMHRMSLQTKKKTKT